MALGTREFLIIEGDLVRITSSRKRKEHLIPVDTVATVLRILPGKKPKYQLSGFSEIFFDASEIELVSYIRSPPGET